MGGAVSWPCSLLGMWCPSTGTNRLVGRAESRLNKLGVGIPRLALVSTRVQEQQAPQKVTQCLCPRAKAGCLSSPGDSLGSAGRSDPGSFQITASALGPGACEILCTPFTSGLSISHSPLADPQSFPTPWGEPVWLCFFSHLWVTLPGVCVSTIPHLCSSSDCLLVVPSFLAVVFICLS